MNSRTNHSSPTDNLSEMRTAIRIVERLDNATPARLILELGALANQYFTSDDSNPEYSIPMLGGVYQKSLLTRILFVATKRVSPNLVIGLDLADEYDEATKH